jgi:hypothetical protein
MSTFSYSSSSASPVPPTDPSLTSHAGPSIWRPPAHWNVDQALSLKKQLRKKVRTSEEDEIIAVTSARYFYAFFSCSMSEIKNCTPRVSSRLASDHALVRFPDVETPFADKLDAINRLLPFHVFLQPQQDLSPFTDLKGKTKARVQEELEIEGLRDCLVRFNQILIITRDQICS